MPLLPDVPDNGKLIEAMFESSPIGIGLLDRERRFVMLNEPLARINGVPREAHIGRSVADLFGASDPHVVAVIDAVCDRGEAFAAQQLPMSIARRPDRQPGFYDVAYAPIAGAGGGCEGIILYVVDVTDRVRHDQLNQEFLAILSHELRTPLNAILGWTTLLARGAPNDPEIAHGLAVIERNARTQSRLIEDLVDVSRMITGRLSLNTTEADLCSIVDAAVDSVRPSAKAKALDVSSVVPEQPVVVSCDPARMQQVILNLLSNAVKFTPRGGSVRITLAADSLNAVVSVQDSGIGITPDFKPFLFDPFRQREQTSERSHGLGLGLAIARDLVRLHGGTISAESAGEGKGTTVTVRLPAAPSSPSANL
jgi:PAS domain S-box-containing protein